MKNKFIGDLFEKVSNSENLEELDIDINGNNCDDTSWNSLLMLCETLKKLTNMKIYCEDYLAWRPIAYFPIKFNSFVYN